MHNLSIKKAGIFALSIFIAVSLAGCTPGKDGDTEIKAVDAGLTAAPEKEADDSRETETTSSDGMIGPMPQPSSAEADPSGSAAPEGDGQNGEDSISAQADANAGDGALSPPSEGSGGSVFGQEQTSEPVTDERMQSLLSGLAFPSANGSWSAYVCNISENTEGSINSHRMQAASLIKLYIMGAVYENYDLLTAQYGQDSVDSNLYSMITVSDNDAANTLTSYLGSGDGNAGMSVVNEYCMANGYNDTHMGRLLLHSNEFDDNYTSVMDCGNFLKRVYQGHREGDSVASAQFQLLAAQTRRNKIPAQMPADVSVANKTGELGDVENDAGIIYNVSNELIIVFMSENLTEVGSAQSTIASLSRQIYDFYNS